MKNIKSIFCILDGIYKTFPGALIFLLQGIARETAPLVTFTTDDATVGRRRPNMQL